MLTWLYTEYNSLKFLILKKYVYTEKRKKEKKNERNVFYWREIYIIKMLAVAFSVKLFLKLNTRKYISFSLCKINSWTIWW